MRSQTTRWRLCTPALDGRSWGRAGGDSARPPNQSTARNRRRSQSPRARGPLLLCIALARAGAGPQRAKAARPVFRPNSEYRPRPRSPRLPPLAPVSSPRLGQPRSLWPLPPDPTAAPACRSETTGLGPQLPTLRSPPAPAPNQSAPRWAALLHRGSSTGPSRLPPCSQKLRRSTRRNAGCASRPQSAQPSHALERAAPAVPVAAVRRPRGSGSSTNRRGRTPRTPPLGAGEPLLRLRRA